MNGSVDLNPLNALLNNDPNTEFGFGGCCTDMKIYTGKWGVRTAFIVEFLYNPGEYGRWPIRDELASFLLDDSGPITNQQVGFTCDFEPLERFQRELKNAVAKLEIGR